MRKTNPWGGRNPQGGTKPQTLGSREGSEETRIKKILTSLRGEPGEAAQQAKLFLVGLEMFFHDQPLKNEVSPRCDEAYQSLRQSLRKNITIEERKVAVAKNVTAMALSSVVCWYYDIPVPHLVWGERGWLDTFLSQQSQNPNYIMDKCYLPAHFFNSLAQCFLFRQRPKEERPNEFSINCRMEDLRSCFLGRTKLRKLCGLVYPKEFLNQAISRRMLHYLEWQLPWFTEANEKGEDHDQLVNLPESEDLDLREMAKKYPEVRVWGYYVGPQWTLRFFISSSEPIHLELPEGAHSRLSRHLKEDEMGLGLFFPSPFTSPEASSSSSSEEEVPQEVIKTKKKMQPREENIPISCKEIGMSLYLTPEEIAARENPIIISSDSSSDGEAE